MGTPTPTIDRTAPSPLKRREIIDALRLGASLEATKARPCLELLGGIRAPLKTATLDPVESCAWSGRYRAELSAQRALPRARRFARPPHPLGAVPPPPLAWGEARCVRYAQSDAVERTHRD